VIARCAALGVRADAHGRRRTPPNNIHTRVFDMSLAWRLNQAGTMHRPRCSTLLLVALVAGCAHRQLSEQKVAGTEAAMRSAEEIGAKGQPDASLHLRYAEDQLAIAQKLLDDGEEERAARMLDRAKIDAELALALARTHRDREQARAAWIRVDELRKDEATAMPGAKSSMQQGQRSGGSEGEQPLEGIGDHNMGEGGQQ
jgi:hypothetical protein